MSEGKKTFDGAKIIVDSREKTPWRLDEYQTVVRCLKTGDYSIEGYEEFICIERKSLQDLIGCIGRERARFKRELERMQRISCAAVVVECNIDDIYSKRYRGSIHPNAVIGSLSSWQVNYNVPFYFAGRYAQDIGISILRNYKAYLDRVLDIDMADLEAVPHG